VLERPEGDGARGGDVERVDTARHRDDDLRVRRRERGTAEARPPGSHHERDLLGSRRRELVEGNGIVGKRHRRDMEPGLVQRITRGAALEPICGHVFDERANLLCLTDNGPICSVR